MTFDDEITAALRRDLQSAHVGFDAAGAADMIRMATQHDPRGERRAYAAPLAAAAAVVVIGGGVATFAATRDGGAQTGGGPMAPPPCATSSASLVPPPGYSGPASPYPPDTTAVVPPSTAAPATAPTPVQSISPSEDPCPTGASASDLPTAVPPTPEPLPASVACSPLDIDPGFSGCITFVVKAAVDAAGSVSFPIPNVAGIPSSSHFTVLTYDVQNPGKNSGTITIEQDNTIIARHRFLPATTSPVLSVDSPVEITTDRPAVVRLSCESTTTRCAATVEVAARILQRVFSTGSATATPASTPPHS